MRARWKTCLKTLVGGLLVLQAIPRATTAPARATTLPRLDVPASGALLGAHVGLRNGMNQPESINQFEREIDHKLAIVDRFHGFDELNFGVEATELAAGRVPMISWRGTSGGVLDPNRAAKIAAGNFDGLLAQAADAMKALRGPVLLRFNWEMDQGPGQRQYIGEPAQFISAWRHMHNVFASVGATNVGWVWCPDYADNPASAWNHWTHYYPGDAYVDWVCADGYNHGTVDSWSHWQTIHELFAMPPRNQTSTVYADYPSKPFMVGETGSVEQGGSKASWFTDGTSYFKSYMPRVKAFVYFERGATAAEPTFNWLVESSQSSLDAYRSVGASSYFNP
jgi:hypothetical protein